MVELYCGITGMNNLLAILFFELLYLLLGGLRIKLSVTEIGHLGKELLYAPMKPTGKNNSAFLKPILSCVRAQARTSPFRAADSTKHLSKRMATHVINVKPRWQVEFKCVG